MLTSDNDNHRGVNVRGRKDALKNALKKNRVEETHLFHGRIGFLVVQDHILESICRHDEGEGGSECQVCRFEKKLGLPHLPEMIFPNNKLALFCNGKLLIEFNAFDALQRVDKSNLPDVKVGPSTVWQNARQQELPHRNVPQPFDWTYTSDYRGTLGEGIEARLADPKVAIDYERLKRKDPIQFYSQLTLYEDELADNGCAQMMVRVRVMPDSFLVLCRFYLRVDHVMIRICDTRLYGEAGNEDFLIREWTKREANYAELSKEALNSVLDPSLVCTHLPLISTETAQIFYQTRRT